jgi:hypothetical protein
MSKSRANKTQVLTSRRVYKRGTRSQSSFQRCSWDFFFLLPPLRSCAFRVHCLRSSDVRITSRCATRCSGSATEGMFGRLDTPLEHTAYGLCAYTRARDNLFDRVRSNSLRLRPIRTKKRGNVPARFVHDNDRHERHRKSRRTDESNVSEQFEPLVKKKKKNDKKPPKKKKKKQSNDPSGRTGRA